MNEEYPDKVVDEHDGVHVLTKLLGRGGQGAVFRTREPGMAVKWIAQPSEARRLRLRDQLQGVRGHLARLPGLPIAYPLDLLRKPYLGYVMKLLTGMDPLTVLINPPKGTSRAVYDWYVAGGGLTRRLRLLARAADAFNRLHGVPLVYADPSPNNVFVSADPSGEEVWLIDADNLHAESAANVVVYTPDYGAPEMVSGKGCVNTLTDAHAFAVIAFRTLALVHPLIGDHVNDGPPELEELALAGRLPWIDHSEEDLNRSSSGLPRELVLSTGLRKLSKECFEDGLQDPRRRPGLARWAEELHAAADLTLTCPDCRWSYFVREKQCPLCDRARPAFVVVAVQRWEPSADGGRGGVVTCKPGKPAEGWANLVMSAAAPLRLTGRTTEALSGPTAHDARLELDLLPQGLRVRPIADGPCWVSSEDGGDRRPLRGAVTLPLARDGRGYRLHFGDAARPHRVALFFAIPEVKA
jgi:DNA-binding helix-hairpin-helix protein with protein kinase domain